MPEHLERKGDTSEQFLPALVVGKAQTDLGQRLLKSACPYQELDRSAWSC